MSVIHVFTSVRRYCNRTRTCLLVLISLFVRSLVRSASSTQWMRSDLSPVQHGGLPEVALREQLQLLVSYIFDFVIPARQLPKCTRPKSTRKIA